MQQYNPAPEELNLPSNHPHKGQSINRTFPKDSAVCTTNMVVVSTGPSVPVPLLHKLWRTSQFFNSWSTST